MSMRLVRSAITLALLTTAAMTLKAAEPPDQCRVAMMRQGSEEELLLGQFTAQVAEETETRKVYPLPGTNLKAIVSVYFTDESIGIDLPEHHYRQDTSIRIILALSESEDDSVLLSPDAAIAEAAIVSQTIEKNLLRVMKVGTTPDGKIYVAAECRGK